jgi:hypothetical protein
MKKIIKLTESDLEQIIKKVLNEQTFPGTSSGEQMGYRERSTPSKPQPKAKEDINPKKLKLGDGGNKSPNLIPDVKILQQKLMDLRLLKTDTMKPTGYFGPKTDKALKEYLGSSNVIPRADKTNNTDSNLKTDKTNSGFILIWAFPQYEPKVDGKTGTAQFFGSLIRMTSGGGTEGTYGKLGHGGCVVIKPNGDATCFEFGRYPGAKKGYGKVLTYSLGKIAKIQNGSLINPEEVASAARKKTYPPGPSMGMTVAVVKLPNPEKSIEYASVKQREYTAADFSAGNDANCGTFARDVASAGGVNIGLFCWPSPISVVKSFKDQSDKFFEI